MSWLVSVTLSIAVLAAGASYQAGIHQWRQERERGLRADDGWLTVAGLFWLKPGPNSFGTGASNDFVLPPHSAPDRAGVFEFRSGAVRVRLEPGISGTINGRRVREAELRPDTPGDQVAIGDLTLLVIRRGDRYGIRLRDKNSEMRRAFKGLEFFPVKESYRLHARFVAAPSKVAVPNVIGQVEEMSSPGYVVFHLNGRSLKLTPVLESPDAKELFFIFRDLTSGHGTYGAGRFFSADLPENGSAVLDFNKAYNPPCAFTPYATCPLPPKENRLPVRIEAGERYSGPGH